MANNLWKKKAKILKSILLWIEWSAEIFMRLKRYFRRWTRNDHVSSWRSSNDAAVGIALRVPKIFRDHERGNEWEQKWAFTRSSGLWSMCETVTPSVVRASVKIRSIHPRADGGGCFSTTERGARSPVQGRFPFAGMLMTSIGRLWTDHWVTNL